MKPLNWKELSANRNNQAVETNQIVRLRSENIIIRAQLANKLQIADEQERRLRELKSVKEDAEQNMKTVESTIRQLLNLLGHQLGVDATLAELLKKLEEKLYEQNKILENYKSKSEETISQLDNLNEENQKLKSYVNEKQIAIKLLEAQLAENKQQIIRQSSNLADFSHRITELEIECKELTAQLHEARNNKNGNFDKQKAEAIKGECYQLLEMISTQGDENLKNYLLQNNPSEINSQVLSRKNKYHFIFEV